MCGKEGGREVRKRDKDIEKEGSSDSGIGRR